MLNSHIQNEWCLSLPVHGFDTILCNLGLNPPPTRTHPARHLSLWCRQAESFYPAIIMCNDAAQIKGVGCGLQLRILTKIEVHGLLPVWTRVIQDLMTEIPTINIACVYKRQGSCKFKLSVLLWLFDYIKGSLSQYDPFSECLLIGSEDVYLGLYIGNKFMVSYMAKRRAMEIPSERRLYPFTDHDLPSKH